MSDTWERVQLASARIPFRVKTAAVWVVLFLILGFFGNAAGFDLQWIRDNFRYILGGLPYTAAIALSVPSACMSPTMASTASNSDVDDGSELLSKPTESGS